MTGEGITLTADEYTIHAREKISTGDYENHEVHATISGSIQTAGCPECSSDLIERKTQEGVKDLVCIDCGNVISPDHQNNSTVLDGDTRDELKARLLSLQKEAQEVVERTAENRIAADGHEDWGVTNDE